MIPVSTKFILEAYLNQHKIRTIPKTIESLVIICEEIDSYINSGKSIEEYRLYAGSQAKLHACGLLKQGLNRSEITECIELATNTTKKGFYRLLTKLLDKAEEEYHSRG